MLDNQKIFLAWHKNWRISINEIYKMKRKNWLSVVIISNFLCLHTSCNEKIESKKESEKTEVKATPLQQTDYDFLHPIHRWALSDSLAEISGIVFQKDGNILAIEDMHPILYELKLGDSSAKIISTTE